MIAEISPATGSAPEATAMPSENGSDTIDTMRPATRSYRQCFNPATPFCGLTTPPGSSLSTEQPPKTRNVLQLRMLRTARSSCRAYLVRTSPERSAEELDPWLALRVGNANHQGDLVLAGGTVLDRVIVLDCAAATNPGQGRRFSTYEKVGVLGVLGVLAVASRASGRPAVPTRQPLHLGVRGRWCVSGTRQPLPSECRSGLLFFPPPPWSIIA